MTGDLTSYFFGSTRVCVCRTESKRERETKTEGERERDLKIFTFVFKYGLKLYVQTWQFSNDLYFQNPL